MVATGLMYLVAVTLCSCWTILAMLQDIRAQSPAAQQYAASLLNLAHTLAVW